MEDLEQKYAARVREAKSAMEFLKEPSSGAVASVPNHQKGRHAKLPKIDVLFLEFKA